MSCLSVPLPEQALNEHKEQTKSGLLMCHLKLQMVTMESWLGPRTQLPPFCGGPVSPGGGQTCSTGSDF